MMRKTVSRLLALVLVLCMVVLCVPLRAQAVVDMTRPEGLTDEQWEELLRLRLLEEAKNNEADLDDTDTITKSPDTGNVVVSETVPITAAPDAAKEQTVIVETPLEAETISENKTENDYEATLPATDSALNPTEATVAESFDLTASATVETTADGEVTDIEYNISLDEHIEAKANGETVAEGKVEDLDKALNTKTQNPSEFKVDMSINGMDDKKVTRVTHKYTTPKETTAPDETPAEETHEEYYYNAANGTEDTTKKYFTITEVETEKVGVGGTLEKVKEKVVSLWTGFLGIFHITTDAFEGTADTNGKKNTYSDLSDAAAGNSGKAVDMLRDYETDKSAVLDNDVNVDLNGHTYTNTGNSAAITSSGSKVAVQNGEIYSGGDGVDVTGGKFSLKNIFLKSNAKDTNTGTTAGIKATGGASEVAVVDSDIDGTNSRYGVQYNGSSNASNKLIVQNSGVVGGTGIAVDNASASISGSYVAGIGKAAKGTNSGAAVAASGNSKVEISSGLYDSARAVDNIYVTGKNASVSITGGRFTDPDHLYDYLPRNRAVISHNDNSYFLYEVVGTDYVPSRDGYRFLGYTDGDGNAITLAEAARRGVIAYAQWKEIPEKLASALTVADLIKVKTDEKNCTTKVTVKGDTAFVTVKDSDGEFAPISEVKVISVKKLQLLKIDTIEIQVDEDVALVLDIEKAKENGFDDTIEVTLDKDTLLITSGKDTCIELDIAVLKASDKPVEIQLVEGELSVQLGKNSTMSVDLTKALKTGERIVVKLENGVLKLYDKYNKPIED